MKKERGITLIALVITIIVLLILAGVTIATLTGDNGLLQKAGIAKNNMNEAEIKEKIKLAYQDYYLGQHTQAEYTFKDALDNIFGEGVVTKVDESNGILTITFADGKYYFYNITTGVTEKCAKWNDNGDGTYTNSENSTKIQVGDTVNYETKLTANEVDSTKRAQLISDIENYSGNTDSRQNKEDSVVRDNLTWKVLDVKDGKIRLISTVPTKLQIRLENADGYNNVVYLLDNACDTLYSIYGVGKAQNLKIEDIEEKLKVVDGKTIVDNYINTNVTPNNTYGDEKIYTSNLKYPNIYPDEIGCKAISSTDNTGNTLRVSEQRTPVTGTSKATDRLKVTQTVWYKEMESTDFTNSIYYSLFFIPNRIFWLSSRSVDCYEEKAIFCVRHVQNSKVRNVKLFFSNDGFNFYTANLRPVITLNPDVEIGEKVNDVWQINN